MNLFNDWYNKVHENKKGKENENDKLSVFENLNEIKEFDQSYFNDKRPNQVLKWHRNTLEKMYKNYKNFVEAFSHPASN